MAMQIQGADRDVEVSSRSDSVHYPSEHDALLAPPVPSALITPVADKRWNRQRWISIYVMFFTMFLSAATFSIVLSSLWPYLLEVDASVTTKFLGGVVAAYSVGQLIASPLLGAWADCRPTREPLIVSLAINIVFSVLYCYAGAFPQEHNVPAWIVLVSRALIGFGAGNAAIVRSYVSEATTEKERVGAMAGVSGSQAIGFIIGPALGLAFVPLKAEGWRISAIRFHLNIYTGPGYLGGLLGVINILLLVFLFRERKLPTNPEDRPMKKVLKSSFRDSLSMSLITRPKWDPWAAMASIVLFFVILFVFAVFETIGTPLTMDEFAWTRTQAVLYNNLFYAGLAVIAILSFVAVKILTKWLNERLLWMIAMFIIAFGFFALLPMGNDYPAVMPEGIEDEATGGANISFVTVYNNTVDLRGCRYPTQHWCITVNKIYLFQYAIALVLIAIGYPISSVMCYSIYSKILGPSKQGTMMGILTAAGSLARSLGPVFVSLLYAEKGPEVTFAAVVGVLAAGILFMTVFYHRLLPYGLHHS